MFATIAYAQGQRPADESSQGLFDPSFMIMMMIIFAIFYFLVFKPQQNKAKEEQEMRNSLKKGDRVITSSGIFGRITGIHEDNITLEIADKVRIKILRGNIAILDKPSSSGKSGKK